MIDLWMYISSSKSCSIRIWCVCSEFWSVSHWLLCEVWLAVTNKYCCCGPCFVQLMQSLFLSPNLIISVCSYICRVCYRVRLTSHFVVLWVDGAAANFTGFMYMSWVSYMCAHECMHTLYCCIGTLFAIYRLSLCLVCSLIFVAESHCSLVDTCSLLKKLWQINFLVFGRTFTFLH